MRDRVEVPEIVRDLPGDSVPNESFAFCPALPI